MYGWNVLSLFALLPSVASVGLRCLTKPFQVLIIQDLTESMDQICHALYETELLKIYLALQTMRSETEIGIMSFKDKPIWPLGAAPTETNPYSDYCTLVEQPFTSNITQLNAWYGSVHTQGGGDPKEAQFYALHRAAASSDFAWSDNADKLAIVITDSPPHFQGDGSTVDMNLEPFSGAFDYNASTDCVKEDYPSAEQVVSALQSKAILTAFLVVDKERALDVWTWFNAQLNQTTSMVQALDVSGLNLSHRIVSMIPSIAQHIKCDPSTSTAASASMSGGSSAATTITLDYTTSGHDAVAQSSSESSWEVSVVTTTAIFPSKHTLPIVQYPTPPPLIEGSSGTTAELAQLPPVPSVPGVGIESRGQQQRSLASDEKGFLARSSTTSASIHQTSSATQVPETDVSEDECSLLDAPDLNGTKRQNFYDCLLESIPGTMLDGSARILIPSSPNYKLATIPFNLARPAVSPIAVIYVNSTQQAVAAVQCGQQYTVQLVPRSGSHDYSSFSFATDSSAVIDVSEIKHIRVDELTETAEIGPGVRLGNVWYEIWHHGKFMLPLGACTTLGFGGHVLGGGYGFFSRAFGIASDYMLEAEVVLANGTVVLAKYSPEGVNDENHGDLFWALRGAGNGHFGVVTNFKYKLIPAPETFTSASLVFVGDHNKKVLQAFVDWAKDAPAGVGASFAAIANRSTIQIAYPGTIDQFWTAMNPFVSQVGQDMFPFVRQSNWLESISELSIMNMNDVDDPVAVPPVRKVPTLEWLNTTLSPERSRFLAHSGFWSLDREFDEDVVEMFDDILQNAPSEYGYTIELFGGEESRINRPVDSGFPHRSSQFIFHIYIRALEGFNPVDQFEYLSSVYYNRIRPIAAPNVYANYHDYTLPNASYHYYVQNLDKLGQIKAQYDPDTLFWFPQVITPHA